MTEAVRIYVALLDEGVEVWRPVLAAPLHGMVYRILAQPYDREAERWEFEPGDEVICAPIKSEDSTIIAANRRAPG